MDDEIVGAEDLSLSFLVRQDLATLSVADLKARIGILESEIGRARRAIEDREGTRAAAEQVFSGNS